MRKPAEGATGRFRFYEAAHLFKCDTCPTVGYLFAIRSDGRIACPDCWRQAGSPFPRQAATPAELFAIEQETRKHMNARGGAARHLVAAGKS